MKVKNTAGTRNEGVGIMAFRPRVEFGDGRRLEEQTKVLHPMTFHIEL